MPQQSFVQTVANACRRLRKEAFSLKIEAYCAFTTMEELAGLVNGLSSAIRRTQRQVAALRTDFAVSASPAASSYLLLTRCLPG